MCIGENESYKPKDAIYIPTGGLYLFQDERSQLMAVTTDGRYTITGERHGHSSEKVSVISRGYTKVVLY